jgi:hypothetical protein
LPEAVEPVTDVPYFPVKPQGGLWTAPIGGCGTAWTDWCVSESYGTPDAPITLVVPDPAAVVYVVDTIDDLRALEGAYYQPGPGGFSTWPQLSWKRMAADLDAVWLTDAGQWATRFSTPSLYGWDCETVFWLQPRFTAGDLIEARKVVR